MLDWERFLQIREPFPAPYFQNPWVFQRVKEEYLVQAHHNMLTSIGEADVQQQLLYVSPQRSLPCHFLVLITPANLNMPHICFCQKDISTS